MNTRSAKTRRWAASRTCGAEPPCTRHTNPPSIALALHWRPMRMRAWQRSRGGRHLRVMGRGAAAGAAYEDHRLVFCDEIGRPYPPDRISAWFKRAAAEAGPPVIRLHDGRHTAATLGLEAGLDIKIVSAQLGHSKTSLCDLALTRCVSHRRAHRCADGPLFHAALWFIDLESGRRHERPGRPPQRGRPGGCFVLNH
jgi:hypothetical protein